MRLLLRILAPAVCSLLLNPVGSSLQASDLPTQSAPTVLKPFLETAPAPVDPKVAAALAGLWTGTFKHKAEDGTQSEDTYLVEVDKALTSLKVTLAPPASASGTASLQSTSQQATPNLFQPTIERQPAIWDGTTLKAVLSEPPTKIGNATVSVEKRLALKQERDNKHAQFSFTIRVQSVKGSSTTTSTLNGSGILTRPR